MLCVEAPKACPDKPPGVTLPGSQDPEPARSSSENRLTLSEIESLRSEMREAMKRGDELMALEMAGMRT